METESSSQLTKSKTQKNKSTNSPEQRTNNEPSNNSEELSALNLIKKYYNGTVEELLLLLNKFNPKEACLQETFLKDKNQLNIKHFQLYNHLYKDGHRASGDVSILIRKDIPQQQININSELECSFDKLHFTNLLISALFIYLQMIP